MSEGTLKKLKLTAYEDVKFKNKVSDGEFTALINPETYSLNYKIEYNDKQGSGTSALESKFDKIVPPELEIQFVFDGTGAVSGTQNNSNDNSVIGEIQKFKDLLIKYNGDQHRPNFIQIAWGTLLFKGTLVNLSFEYKLFKPDGSPLRATAKTSFKGSVESDLRAAQENNSSPDLTHLRTVKAGDTLPLMAYRVYGDPKYYLEVAKYNNITNFRALKTGQKLFFPPLEKQR